MRQIVYLTKASEETWRKSSRSCLTGLSFPGALDAQFLEDNVLTLVFQANFTILSYHPRGCPHGLYSPVIYGSELVTYVVIDRQHLFAPIAPVYFYGR